MLPVNQYSQTSVCLKLRQGRYFSFFLTFCFVLEYSQMAPYSRTVAWKISWTEEHGGLQSMGSLRVGQD